MSKRAHISVKSKLAAALCALFEIPYDDAKNMHEEQVLSLVHWDHYPIRKADGGGDDHFNLVPRLIAAHRKKTAEKDIPELAKTNRIAARQLIFEANMALKAGALAVAAERLAPLSRPGRARPKRKIPSRVNPWPKGRKLQSRKRS